MEARYGDSASGGDRIDGTLCRGFVGATAPRFAAQIVYQNVGTRGHRDRPFDGQGLVRGGSRALRRGRRAPAGDQGDRKSVVYGKSVSVRVDLGGRRDIKKHKRPYKSKKRKR